MLNIPVYSVLNVAYATMKQTDNKLLLKSNQGKHNFELLIRHVYLNIRLT